jgi:hypothetical protein
MIYSTGSAIGQLGEKDAFLTMRTARDRIGVVGVQPGFTDSRMRLLRRQAMPVRVAKLAKLLGACASD